jgi:hypothetical protein
MVTLGPAAAVFAFTVGLASYYQLEVVGSESWRSQSPDHRYLLEGWKYYRPVATPGDGASGAGYLRLVDAGGRVVRVQAVDDQSLGLGVDAIAWRGDAVELCYSYIDRLCVRWPLDPERDRVE